MKWWWQRGKTGNAAGAEEEEVEEGNQKNAAAAATLRPRKRVAIWTVSVTLHWAINPGKRRGLSPRPTRSHRSGSGQLGSGSEAGLTPAAQHQPPIGAHTRRRIFAPLFNVFFFGLISQCFLPTTTPPPLLLLLLLLLLLFNIDSDRRFQLLLLWLQNGKWWRFPSSIPSIGNLLGRPFGNMQMMKQGCQVADAGGSHRSVCQSQLQKSKRNDHFQHTQEEIYKTKEINKASSFSSSSSSTTTTSSSHLLQSSQ